MRRLLSHLILMLVSSALNSQALCAEFVPTVEFSIPGIDQISVEHADTLSMITLLKQVGQTLTEEGPFGELLPGIARSWQISQDRKHYTFNLRNDISFHTGKKLTARDVVYSLNRSLYAEGNPISNALEVIDGYKDGKAKKRCSGIRLVSDYQIVVSLSKAFSPLLAALATGMMSIVPEDSRPGTTFVGTGPYRIVKDKAGFTLEPFANYRGQYPPGKLRWRVMITKPGSVKDRAKTGNIGDFVFDGSKRSDFPNNYRVETIPELATGIILINAQKKKWSDISKRQALSMALLKLRTIALNESADALPLADVFPKGMIAYSDHRASAKILFDPKPIGFPEISKSVGGKVILTAYALPSWGEKAKEAMRRDLGIDLEWNLFRGDDATKHFLNGDSDAALLTWANTFSDPASNVLQFQLLRRYFEQIDTIDSTQLLQRAAELTDSNERAAIYGSFADFLFRQSLAVPVWQFQYVLGLSPKLSMRESKYRYSIMLSDIELSAK